MKKVLLAITILLSLVSFSIAQNNINTPKSDTVGIAALSEKIDAFIVSQKAVTVNLDTKINRANTRLQDLQNQSSLRWLLRDMIPIIVLLLVGGIIVFIIFILTRSTYQNRKLKYDTLLRCTEMTGSVPDLFTRHEITGSQVVRKKNSSLIIAIICGVIAVFTMIAAVNLNGVPAVMFMAFCFLSSLTSMLLFIQIYQRNSENSRTNQQ